MHAPHLHLVDALAIVAFNGLKFTAKAVREWLVAVGARMAFIAPGSPGENGYCESFDARLPDELLNGEIFYWLTEATVAIESWRRHDNAVRPHSSPGYRPPAPKVVQWPPTGPASPATPALAQRAVVH
ncbi:transposase [Aurantimonas aggregata]|uniref:Transposase n=1 Tax=Aurantimonas aggregata TaxID=2047720 RepID=A0A6L9MNZ0_9HYPH|nr:transposase [Aurantimonas aggregata]